MAKKRRKQPEMPSAPMWKAPSPAEQMRQAAEHVGRTVVEVHPKIKKMRDHITRSVLGAAKKAVGDSARGGQFGGY